MNKITEIPDEILIAIFLYCPIKTLVSVERTSKRFYKLLSDSSFFWKFYCQNIWGDRFTNLNENRITFKKICFAKEVPLLLICRYFDTNDVLESLQSNGLSNIEVANDYMPNLKQMSKYHAIMLIGNANSFLSMNNAKTLGNDLANYVDQQYGGVVLCCFANSSNIDDGHVQGRFKDEDYFPITCAVQSDVEKTFARIKKEHFIVSGLSDRIKLDKRRRIFFIPGKLNKEAELIADYDREKKHEELPVLAVMEKKLINGKIKDVRIIGINIFVPYHCKENDVVTVMLNSLIYATSGRKNIPRFGNK